MAKVAVGKGKISVKSLIVTMIKKTTILTNILSQKIAVVLAIFIFVSISLETLQDVLYIQYPVQVQRSKFEIEALINSGSEINAMILVYIMKLGFTTQKTSVGA